MYLGNNRISNIGSAAFSHLINCTKLWLDNNALTHVEVTDFTGLSSLKELVLPDNFITEIETGSFLPFRRMYYDMDEGKYANPDKG